jgi:hypothetical protein
MARKKKTGPMLLQIELARIRQAQTRVSTLSADLAVAKEDLARQDKLAQVILQIPGVVIEPGPLTGSIKIDRRRNIPWKSVCITEIGLPAVEKIAEAWPQDEIARIVVTELRAESAA